mgnify:CR=1 FL=1|tara:strand:+ start:886 stop:2028 length:1143 start_codon:yes stop_codon:yes gene_type:complete
MYRIFYAERDTTLYERYPDQNTGIDQILEITKIASGSKLNGIIQGNTYNSRFLIDFGTEITTLTNEVNAGNIPPIGDAANSASVFLRIYAASAEDLLTSYTINAFPSFDSWSNGNGNYSDAPIQKYGASWYYRTSDDAADGWTTASVASSGTVQGTTNTEGGGAWYTGSGFKASQSFTNEAPDMRMNVTDIVANWVSGSINNNGFVIKRPYRDEISGLVLGSLKFFGRETHTIYVPRLEVKWDDHATSSLSIVTADTYVPYIKNIKSEYRTSEITKFRVGVRPAFPTRTFQTASFYMTNELLPLSSSYSIIDTVTNETIIPFTDNWANSKTKISADGNGNYFKLRMDNFFPERYYKIMLKCERSADTQTFDDGFHFKVVK